MTTNTKNTLTELPAAALLKALPEAALICDSTGSVLAANPVAVRQFPTLSGRQAHLNDVFKDPTRVACAVRSAMLAGHDVPAELITRADQSPMRLSLRELDAMTSGGRRYFLLRFDANANANANADCGGVRRQMMSLARTLSRTADENEALLMERDRLRRVVDRTLPKLKVLSYQDALTGLGNRRSFDKALDAEWARLSGRRVPVSVILVDVDHFKAYNDAYGHLEGDAVLKLVGETLRRSAARHGDQMCRIGGEEFAVLLPNTDTAGAVRVAETIRESVIDLDLEHPLDGMLSVSAGVATVEPCVSRTKREFLEQADAALYRAKRSGRNQVQVDESVTEVIQPTAAAG
ncbi:MAG: GGDEF domain-containing protein [Pseudomonadota bacterium]